MHFFWCSCGPGEKSTSHFPAGRAGLSPHTLDGDSGAKLINKDSNLRPSSEFTSSEITCISNTGMVILVACCLMVSVIKKLG